MAVVEQDAGIRKRGFDQQLCEAVVQVIKIGHVLAQVFRLGEIPGMAGFSQGGVDQEPGMAVDRSLQQVFPKFVRIG